MSISLVTAEAVLAEAVRSISDLPAIQPVIDALSAPVYVTNTNGLVTHANKACANFAGRSPIPERDRWCVTWRLYTSAGEHLPHANCPMAVAIERRQPIRGLTAIAERPDGTRVAFMPFPTPLFDSGEFIGAINMLIDLTNVRQVEALREQAARCRRLAATADDERTAAILTDMAADYDVTAHQIEAASR